MKLFQRPSIRRSVRGYLFSYKMINFATTFDIVDNLVIDCQEKFEFLSHLAEHFPIAF